MYNHQLDAFLQTADSGSFSKAAEAMFITPPAIIKQINLLEAHCGFSLFVRTHHGVQLTPAGRSLYEDAKILIRLSEDALRKAGRIAKQEEPVVRVGTSLLFKCRLLPDLWAGVSELCPELKLELVPIRERVGGEPGIAAVGTQYDMKEGIFCTISQAGR